MFKINIVVDDLRWKKEAPTIEKILKKNFKKIFTFLGYVAKKQNLEISVLLTNKEVMKKLNKNFRKIKKDTDVLSFPNYEKKFFLKEKNIKDLYLGDLAFSYDYIKKQKFDFLNYINKIFIHGCLHLIGYEHNNLKSYRVMSSVEKKLLSDI
jgi:probable rRNA maturation factor